MGLNLMIIIQKAKKNLIYSNSSKKTQFGKMHVPSSAVNSSTLTKVYLVLLSFEMQKIKGEELLFCYK